MLGPFLALIPAVDPAARAVVRLHAALGGSGAAAFVREAAGAREGFAKAVLAWARGQEDAGTASRPVRHHLAAWDKLDPADLHVAVLDMRAHFAARTAELAKSPLLYLRGKRAHLVAPAIAVVGMRRPSPGGRAAAMAVARGAAVRGQIVISGNAPGIDAAAHAAALAAGGVTVVCPPGPLDKYRPIFAAMENAADRVLVMTAAAPGSGVEPYRFLQRNVLVAGHARAAVVAETGYRGGTHHTIRMCGELGTPVAAVRHHDDTPHAEPMRLVAERAALTLPVHPRARDFHSLLALEPARRADFPRDVQGDLLTSRH